MKKNCLAIVALCVAFVVIACGTTPVVTDDPVSDFIDEVRRTRPENALLGIGTSTHENRGLARTTAETRARAEVTRQLDVVVRNMINDYMAGSEEEGGAVLQFSESVIQTLAQSRLQGSEVHRERRFGNETVVVVMLSRNNIANEIMTASQAASALAPHMGAALWAQQRMDEALTQQNMAPPVIVRD